MNLANVSKAYITDWKILNIHEPNEEIKKYILSQEQIAEIFKNVKPTKKPACITNELGTRQKGAKIKIA